MTDKPAPSSAKAEQAYPVTMARMMGLETAATMLGGKQALADALVLDVRTVRYKLTGDRGVSNADLTSTAAALDALAGRVAAHAAKLRAEVGPRAAGKAGA
jgi:hypothetical protein